MILAINVNAALDWVYFIERFVSNSDMVAPRVVMSIGGKGLDAALVLQTLGAPVQAITFLAGKNGEILAGLLEQHHIPCELIWVPGETRLANVIVETGIQAHSHLTSPGYQVNRNDCDSFLARIIQFAPQAPWALMGGSLPQGTPVDFYREIIAALHQQGVKALIDGRGAPLLKSLSASPEIVKMNQAEFQTTFQTPLDDPGKWVSTCRSQMTHNQMTCLVITLGKQGILALTPDGVFHAGCDKNIKAVNSAGAGDAVSAALTYRLSLGDTWPQALTWAAATSSAVVLTEGTAECDLPDILELYKHTWVNQIG